jgi:hypothetical protein
MFPEGDANRSAGSGDRVRGVTNARSLIFDLM